VGEQQLIRLTIVRIKRAGDDDWSMLTLNSASVDALARFVGLVSEIPPIEASEGAEIELHVQWVIRPSNNDE
jgi:hypothetical protein